MQWIKSSIKPKLKRENAPDKQIGNVQCEQVLEELQHWEISWKQTDFSWTKDLSMYYPTRSSWDLELSCSGMVAVAVQTLSTIMYEIQWQQKSERNATWAEW